LRERRAPSGSSTGKNCSPFKTGLQHDRRGEGINREVAADARVGGSVLMTSSVKETDEELRARSNRTYRRILASLTGEVARRYGHA
jgi:hypothetical protein